MSKYATASSLANKPKRASQKAGKPVINAAGGLGYSQSSRLELVSLLLTSFMQDEHYRSAADTQARLRALVAANDPVFAAKAAVYARDTFGMRSVSHVVAAEIAKTVKGADWTRNFYNRIVIRPDDVTEILGLVMSADKDAPIPNALKRGLGAALSRFNEYQLSKYKGEGHALKLVDAVNLLHPRGTPALNKLVKGKLKPAETWETKLSAAGQSSDASEKEAAKDQAWKDLLESGKLGYLAALRNLRNILEQSAGSVPQLVKLLTDGERLKKARIFPFQILKAYEVVEALGGSTETRLILGALSDAMDLSVSNVPAFDGTSAVLLDVSGSMASNGVVRIGGIFTAVLAKAWNADVMLWSTSARNVSFNPRDSVMTVAQGLEFTGGGTNLSCAFNALNRRYDRVVVLSDMQTWVDGSTGAQPAWKGYCQRHGVKPHLYSFDLKNYGTSAFPEDKVYCLAGYSDAVFDVMGKLEQDREALVHAVEAVDLSAPMPKAE